MSTRTILGFNSSETSQQQSNATESQPVQPKATDMPLAVELPNWDLVPSDALLVRRRPAKK